MKHLFCLALLLLCNSALPHEEPSITERPFVAVELQFILNTWDGCTDCRCRLNGHLEFGEQKVWWGVVGLVSPDEGYLETLIGRTPSCSTGSFDDAAQDFIRTVGFPFVKFDLVLSVQEAESSAPVLNSEVRTSRFAGFDSGGKPEYVKTIELRPTSLAHSSELTIPLFSFNESEGANSGAHEIVLDLSATLWHRDNVAAYGTLAVRGDVPGASVYLDGGFVGRLLEDEPLVLHNIPVGKRVIKLVDYSNRKSSRQVQVEEDALTEVSLQVLDLGRKGMNSDIVPVGENPQGLSEYWRTRDGALLVHVPAGKFLMGSPEQLGEANEKPQHEVELPAFLVDKNEVTWRQYLKYADAMEASIPPTPVWGRLGNYPVSFVLYAEAAGYCDWVGGRLPTEAEWEKAARGANGRTYPWGDEWEPARCNSIAGGMHRPEPAGAFPLCHSPYGVLDMAGSVKEWTSDGLAAYPYDQNSGTEPNDETHASYVMRGGGWMSQPGWIRAAYRVSRSPNSRLMDHGFRCVMDYEVPSG